jgi:hypothetical protein
MLKTKQVGEFTATQMGALERAHMKINYRLIEERKIEDEAEREAAQEWALINACVTPKITLDQYLQTPVTDTIELIEAVEELNSDMAEKVSKKKNAS